MMLHRPGRASPSGWTEPKTRTRLALWWRATTMMVSRCVVRTTEGRGLAATESVEHRGRRDALSAFITRDVESDDTGAGEELIMGQTRCSPPASKPSQRKQHFNISLDHWPLIRVTAN